MGPKLMQVFIPTLPKEGFGKLCPRCSLFFSLQVSGEALSSCWWKDQAGSTQMPSHRGNLCPSLAAVSAFIQNPLFLHNKQILESCKERAELWDLSACPHQGAELFRRAPGHSLLSASVPQPPLQNSSSINLIKFPKSRPCGVVITTGSEVAAHPKNINLVNGRGFGVLMC